MPLVILKLLSSQTNLKFKEFNLNYDVYQRQLSMKFYMFTDLYSFLCYLQLIDFYRPKMVWTKQHDIMLAREILVARPFVFKFGSRERGQAWDKVAEALNTVKQLRFHVDQRGVRERYEKLKKAYQKRMREEARASGISPEINELDEAIESIVELSEVAEKEIMEAQGAKNKLSETERETAESVRKRSMERLSQTRERENLESSKKKRRSGNGMVEYLQEKEAREEQQKKIDVELRERHLALEERKHNEAMVIEQNKFILREKELAILANQQEEREKRDGELLSSMRKIIEQQQEIIKQLQQQMHLLTSIEKKQ